MVVKDSQVRAMHSYEALLQMEDNIDKMLRMFIDPRGLQPEAPDPQVAL